MNKSMFRQYDIRGLVGVDFEPYEAELVGKAFGTFIKERFVGKRVVVGHDNRFTSDELNDFFIHGLIDTGCSVTDIGLAVTPLVHYAVTRYGFDAGCIVTASHNPKEFNGFRFDGPGCQPIFGDDIQEIRKIIDGGLFREGEGSVTYQEIYPEYANDIGNRIHIQRPIKVVLDCGNGATSEFAPRLYDSLGMNVTAQHCALHGGFPHHTADPEQRINMRDTIHRVVQEKAEIGIGFDTDGDRFGVVDENGKLYNNDEILIILARDILNRFPGRKVLFDVKSSYVLEDEIRKAGGEPIMIRTGHPYFRQALRDDPSILIGGEVSSHTFIQDNYYGYDDGLFAGLRVLEVLSRQEGPFSSLLSDVEQTYHTEEIRLPTPDDQKFDIVQELIPHFESSWEVITIDGMRIKFSPRSWALVRASNTSPNLTVRFEANTAEELERIIEITHARLQQYPVVDISLLTGLLLKQANALEHEHAPTVHV